MRNISLFRCYFSGPILHGDKLLALKLSLHHIIWTALKPLNSLVLPQMKTNPRKCNCLRQFVYTFKKKRVLYHFLDFSLGGGFLGIRKRALIGCMSHKAARGKSTHTHKLLKCTLQGCSQTFVHRSISQHFSHPIYHIYTSPNPTSSEGFTEISSMSLFSECS